MKILLIKIQPTVFVNLAAITAMYYNNDRGIYFVVTTNGVEYWVAKYYEPELFKHVEIVNPSSQDS